MDRTDEVIRFILMQTGLLQKVMKVKPLALAVLLIVGFCAPATAQLALPRVGDALGQTLGTLDQTLDPALGSVRDAAAGARELLRRRTDRIAGLVRANRDTIERDQHGDLARKGELLIVDPQPGALDQVRAAGFAVLSDDRLGELGVAVAKVGVPAGIPLAKAQGQLAALLPGATITADTLHQPSGTASGGKGTADAPTLLPPVSAPVGMIDGAPASASEVRGFARGAPRPSDHGSAVASLLRMAGVKRTLAADVYGSDPAGGNALAVARALDWLVGAGVRVVSISLVGPSNPLLVRAIEAAHRRGAVIVAAVGNDGPAAPPSYPASYPGVIAVTAVDGHNQPLIEAGRALHLDYAAPGADMLAANSAGRWARVRGTSFAAPLVAARAAAALGGNVIQRLDAEAIDLGAKGHDPRFGRGLICAICRRTR